MRIKFFAIFFIFLILAPVTAQDEPPLPVLHAEDIFAEGLVVLQQLPNTPPSQPHVPLQVPDSSLWSIIEVEGQFHLINSETGQQSASFPFGGIDTDWLSSIRPVASPDGRYVAFRDDFPIGARSAFMYAIYLYDTQSNQVQQIGTTDLSQRIELQWINSTTLLIYARPDITRAHPFRLYRYDTDDTWFEKIADASHSEFSYFDNPARVLWAEALEPDWGNEAFMLQEYRFDTDQTQTLFPINCSYICNILWHNDKTISVQNVSNVGATPCNWWIYDTQNGNLLFEDISGCEISEETNTVGENYWIYCAGEETARSSCTLRLLDMRDFSTSDIIPVLSWWYPETSPQGRYIYLYTHRYNAGRNSPYLEIYDIEAEKLYSILKHENLSISEFLWLIDDSFIVSVSDEAGNDIGRWHIRIEALNEGQS